MREGVCGARLGGCGLGRGPMERGGPLELGGVARRQLPDQRISVVP